jgi:hypothetical protein
MEMQAAFVGGIVLPLWQALAVAFPRLTFAARQAEANQCFYQERAEALCATRGARAVLGKGDKQQMVMDMVTGCGKLPRNS